MYASRDCGVISAGGAHNQSISYLELEKGEAARHLYYHTHETLKKPTQPVC